MNEKTNVGNYLLSLKNILNSIVKKPYGTYNLCQSCYGTWWDDERPRHRLDCEYPRAFDEFIEVSRKAGELAAKDAEHTTCLLVNAEIGKLNVDLQTEVIDLKEKLETLQSRLSAAEALLYEFSNNPNIELGEKGHAKLDEHFAALQPSAAGQEQKA